MPDGRDLGVQVSYPMQLDMFDFCTDELKEQLRGPRAALRRIEDEKAGVARGDGDNEAGDATDADGDAVMGTPVDHTGALTARYDLLAVLTHKVRAPLVMLCAACCVLVCMSSHQRPRRWGQGSRRSRRQHAGCACSGMVCVYRGVGDED